MRINNLGEFGFINRIKQGCMNREDGVIAGIGDDCAVFRTSEDKVTLLTTDMLIERVHFRRDHIPPRMLGRKSLAASVSDIAAMGGIPREAVVSVGIPGELEIDYLDHVYDGLKSMASEFEINLLGGDTVRSPDGLIINVALTGEVSENEILYRNGARTDDVVFVTGRPGLSAAGLDLLVNKRDFRHRDKLLRAHFDPRPQIKEGRLIAASGLVNSLIDVSDGLAADLWHICEQSHVGAVIDAGGLPEDRELLEYMSNFGLEIEDFISSGGEDYILLGTAPRENAAQLGSLLAEEGCEYYRIGYIIEKKSLSISRADGRLFPLKPRGHDHFRS